MANPRKIRYLACSAAGVNGACHVGAVNQLAKEGNLNDLVGVAGSSAGAIMSFLLATKCPPAKIQTLFFNINFKKVADGHNVINEGLNTIKQDSLYDGKQLRDVISSLFHAMNLPINITFADLKRQGFLDLYVTTTKVGRSHGRGTTELKVFSLEETPDTAVFLGVLASASQQALFPPILMKEVKKGHFVEMAVADEQTFMFGDGGFSLYLPLELFDKKKYLSTYQGGVDGNEAASNPEAFGLMVDVPPPVIMSPVLPGNPLEYAFALMNGAICLTQTGGRNFCLNNPDRAILISNNNISSDNFNVTPLQEKLDIHSGELAVRNFFHPDSHDKFLEEKSEAKQSFTQLRRSIGSPISARPSLPTIQEEERPNNTRCCAIL
jgi:predicted acylesterase/phospholipase RssA